MAKTLASNPRSSQSQCLFWMNGLFEDKIEERKLNISKFSSITGRQFDEAFALASGFQLQNPTFNIMLDMAILKILSRPINE